MNSSQNQSQSQSAGKSPERKLRKCSLNINMIRLNLDQIKTVQDSKNNPTEKRIVTGRLSKIISNLQFNEHLKIMMPFFQNRFEKLFRIASSNVEYKPFQNSSYQKVQIILEPNRLLVGSTHHKIKNSNEQLKEKSSLSVNEIKNPLVILNFDQITAGLSVKSKLNKFRIYVLGCKFPFKFKIISGDLYKQILIHLNYFISVSLGNQSNLLGVSLRKYFFKMFFIYENDFIEKAKTGDILIFRGYECAAKCQRCLTRAQYDHVALLHKRGDDLYVYESTSKEGVMLRNWRDFIIHLWNLLYEKMVYRELIINMEESQKNNFIEDIKQKAEDFILETQKKKYKLSCCALCRKSVKESEKSNKWGESEGFFCSQLVAAAYLKCGIMPYVNQTGGYLPGDFAENNFVRLNPSFELGPEKVIEFSI